MTGAGTEWIRLCLHAPRATAGRRGWHSVVERVDRTRANTFAFGGRYIPDGVEVDLRVGTILVRKTPVGSGRFRSWIWSWTQVMGGGDLVWAEPYPAGRFLSFRDEVADVLLRTQGDGQQVLPT